MSRHTPQSLEKRIAALENAEDAEDDADDLPTAGLCTIFGASELELLDDERGIYRIDGERYRIHESIVQTFGK